MNIVLLSPNFPPSYYQFAVALRSLDVNVFGIGDAPFDALLPELRQALTEYYSITNTLTGMCLQSVLRCWCITNRSARSLRARWATMRTWCARPIGEFYIMLSVLYRKCEVKR